MDYAKQRDYVNENNPFMRLCGITLTQVEQDRAVSELTVDGGSFNPGGTLHGGAFYTLADAAATTAARTDGHRYATIDGTIHYHRPITAGLVRATATIRRRGRSLCTVGVEMTDESGKLLADAVFSIFRMEPIDRPEFQD